MRKIPDWARALNPELATKMEAAEPVKLAWYGLCTYWNDMDAFGEQIRGPRTVDMPHAGQRPGTIPLCPFCGSPGFQAPLADFIASIDTAPEPERSAWHRQRGRPCFRGDDAEQVRAAMISAYGNDPDAA